VGDPDFQNQVLSTLSDIRERLARVEAVHVERCSAQGRRLDDLEDRQNQQEQAIQGLKEHRSFTRGQQAALTAAGTVLGSAAGAVAAHFLGGK